MMLSLSVSLIWLLALLATSAHVQPTAKTPAAILSMVVAFALVLTAAVWLSPQPNWIGVLVGLTAIWQLIGGPLGRAGNLLGPVCAALAAALQMAGGLPVWFAAPIALGALFAAVLWLPRESGRNDVRDVTLIVTALVTPAIGLAGDLVYGWHSAAMLGQNAAARQDVATPAWAVAIVMVALLGGALRGIWKKR